MAITWELCIRQLLEKEPDEITAHDYIYNNQRWDDFILNEDPFKVCLYTNTKGKMSKLYREYFNIDAWSNLKNTYHVKISMIGAPKSGTNAKQKHCIIYLDIDHNEKKVVIHFRNSDFFKKFLVDVYFVKALMEEYGLLDYSISIEFEKLTLRLAFAYIFLNYIYNKRGDVGIVEEFLNLDLFSDFIRYYKKHLDKDCTWKSLERCARYMKQTEVYPILSKYIKEL